MDCFSSSQLDTEGQRSMIEIFCAYSVNLLEHVEIAEVLVHV